jgi:hypothetical protein
MSKVDYKSIAKKIKFEGRSFIQTKTIWINHS